MFHPPKKFSFSAPFALTLILIMNLSDENEVLSTEEKDISPATRVGTTSDLIGAISESLNKKELKTFSLVNWGFRRMVLRRMFECMRVGTIFREWDALVSFPDATMRPKLRERKKYSLNTEIFSRNR